MGELCEGNPVRVRSIYERRSTHFCLQPHVWTEYADYLEVQLKDMENAKVVIQRGTRNCPWHVDLWIKLLRLCEKIKCDKKEICKIAEDALSASLADPVNDYRRIWLAFIDYKRRNILNEDDVEVSEKNKE